MESWCMGVRYPDSFSALSLFRPLPPPLGLFPFAKAPPLYLSELPIELGIPCSLLHWQPHLPGSTFYVVCVMGRMCLAFPLLGETTGAGALQ